MPKFKHPETGNVIEVDEVFAEQVLRPQNKYIEITEEEERHVKEFKIQTNPADVKLSQREVHGKKRGRKKSG